MSGETRTCYQALPASVGDPGQITPSYQPGPVEIGKKKKGGVNMGWVKMDAVKYANEL